MEDVDQNFLDRKVLWVIKLTLFKLVACNIVIKEKINADRLVCIRSHQQNNKFHLKKKLSNLKMAEDMSIAQNLNVLINIITNQSSSIEIEFDNDLWTLIQSISLLNGWETMKMFVSNSINKIKLEYNYIRDFILAKKLDKRDSTEIFGLGSNLSIDI